MGTRTAGECSHSFFEFSQTFTSQTLAIPLGYQEELKMDLIRNHKTAAAISQKVHKAPLIYQAEMKYISLLYFSHIKYP